VFQLLQKTIESTLPCESDNEVGISYKILKVDGQFQLILSYALGFMCAAGGCAGTQFQIATVHFYCVVSMHTAGRCTYARGRRQEGALFSWMFNVIK
jgi:hypothetical protein